MKRERRLSSAKDRLCLTKMPCLTDPSSASVRIIRRRRVRPAWLRSVRIAEYLGILKDDEELRLDSPIHKIDRKERRKMKEFKASGTKTLCVPLVDL